MMLFIALDFSSKSINKLFPSFYFLLCRERLYTLRQILKIGDAMELQDYPFRLAYIGDLEDTIDFSLDFLNSDKFKEKSAIA